MASRRAGQAQRDRRAKLALGALGLVLVGVLGFEGARALTHRSSGATATPAAAGTRVAGQPAALTLAVANAPATLARFSGLAARDPFRAQVATGAAAATPAAPPATTKTPGPTLTIAKSPATTTPGEPLLPAALLKLNGTKQVVVVGRTFPAKEPLFRLTSVGRSAMWITLLRGSFVGGDRLLKVAHGHPAKLVAAGGGKVSFLLALVRVTAAHVPPTPQKPGTKPPATTTTFTTTAPAGTTQAVTTNP